MKSFCRPAGPAHRQQRDEASERNASDHAFHTGQALSPPVGGEANAQTRGARDSLKRWTVESTDREAIGARRDFGGHAELVGRAALERHVEAARRKRAHEICAAGVVHHTSQGPFTGRWVHARGVTSRVGSDQFERADGGMAGADSVRLWGTAPGRSAFQRPSGS